MNHLRTYCAKQDTAIAFFYCDYQDQSLQTALGIVANLVKQVVQSKISFFKPLQELYENMISKSIHARPNLKDLESLLLSACDTFGRSYIVVDALDECALDQRKLLLPLFQSLREASIKVFVTSRRHAQDVERAFCDHTRVEIRATESDLQDYVTNQIEDDEDLTDLLPDELKTKIVSSISNGARGMYVFKLCDHGSASKLSLCK